MVREVYELRPADLLEVTRPDGRPLMIPFVREILVEVDLGEGVMIIDPPEGLLDL